MKKLSTNQQLLTAVLSAVLFASLYLHFDLKILWLEHKLDQGGDIFIQSLQVFAIPLVLFSIIMAVSSMQNAARLKRVAFYSIVIYAITTLFSVLLGVCLGFLFKPGVWFRQYVKNLSTITGGENLLTNQISTEEPSKINNLVQLLSDNNNLLLALLFALVVALAILKLPSKKKTLILAFCETMNDIFIKIINWIIQLAPLGLFCIFSSQIITLGQDNDVLGLATGLAIYAGTVIFGILIMLFLVYPICVKFFTKIGYREFVKKMYPAQMFAFTTSSSTASLAKTSEQVGKMGVPERIRSFVLGLGATVNMDGTALYQGVLAVFIMQVFKIEITFGALCYIIGYVTVSTAGVAGAPGASLISTQVMLASLGLNPSQISNAIKLITMPDRGLDMFRTAGNITGDSSASAIVHAFEMQREMKKALPEIKIEQCAPGGIRTPDQ
ncbi:MAG: dicarboxylate/amino acid:cation symporter [Cytophagales bacterium]